MKIVGQFLSVLGAIVVVAGITVLVKSAYTATDIRTIGCEFANAIRAALNNPLVKC